MVDVTINLLNEDCLIEIFSYLSIYDLINAQKVCRRWEILCYYLWRRVKYLYCEELNFAPQFKSEKYEVNYAKNLQISQLPDSTETSHDSSIAPGQFLNINLNILSTISQQCKNLQEISIKIPRSIIPVNEIIIKENNDNIDETISTLLVGNKQLKYFSLQNLSGSRNISIRCFEFLPINLEKLVIIECNRIESSTFINAMKKLRCLHTLVYDFSHWHDDTMANIIGEMKTLTNLSLKNSCKLPSSFNNLANLVNLERLNLESNLNLEDNELINIVNNCKQLKSLDISHCYRISNRGMIEISKLTMLEELKIIYLSNVTDEVVGNLPNTIRFLWCSHCPKLKDNGLIRLINTSINLSSLDVRECHGITNNLIHAAKNVAETRATLLEIHVRGSGINFYEWEQMYGEDLSKVSTFFRLWR